MCWRQNFTKKETKKYEGGKKGLKKYIGGEKGTFYWFLKISPKAFFVMGLKRRLKNSRPLQKGDVNKKQQKTRIF